MALKRWNRWFHASATHTSTGLVVDRDVARLTEEADRWLLRRGRGHEHGEPFHVYFSVSKPPKSATQTFPASSIVSWPAAAGEFARVASLGPERELVGAGEVEHVECRSARRRRRRRDLGSRSRRRRGCRHPSGRRRTW